MGNEKSLTGKKMLGGRAKIPVSFMQLLDALINGHLLREEEKKLFFSRQETKSNDGQIIFFISEYSV